jgi:hypothetical protein
MLNVTHRRQIDEELHANNKSLQTKRIILITLEPFLYTPYAIFYNLTAVCYTFILRTIRRIFNNMYIDEEK